MLVCGGVHYLCISILLKKIIKSGKFCDIMLNLFCTIDGSILLIIMFLSLDSVTKPPLMLKIKLASSMKSFQKRL